MISTIFALSYYDSKKYIQTIKKTTIKKGINKKAVEWVQEIFLPFIRDNPEKKEEFAQFLLRSCMMTPQSDLFLLWLMKYGIKQHHHFLGNNPEILRKSWLYFDMLEFLYSEANLCEKYGINQNTDENLALIHLCSQIILGKDSKVKKEFLMDILSNYLYLFFFSAFIFLFGIKNHGFKHRNQSGQYRLSTQATRKMLCLW